MGAGQSGLSEELLSSHQNLGSVHNYKAIEQRIGSIKTNGIKIENLDKQTYEQAKKSVLSQLEKEMKSKEKNVLNLIAAKNKVNQNRLRVAVKQNISKNGNGNNSKNGNGN